MTRSYGIALFVLQKVSCFLSATGSLMIMSQVSRSAFNRSKPQQRLILGLSVSDFCVSVNWILTPLFMPPESGAVWAVGNQTTCNIQGFIVTLFISSAILYMLALQLQYLLTIKHGWSETRIRRDIEIYMHVIPWVLGLTAAITDLSLKLYNPADWDCWIAPFPSDCTSSHEVKKGGTGLTETDCIRGDNAEIYRWSFFFAPLWVAIVTCIIFMVLIFRSVREKERASMKYSSQRFLNMTETPRRRRSQRYMRRSSLLRTQQVKTQCFMYAGGFFIVWTFPTIARLIQLLGGTIHPVIGVLAGTFIGSQGLFNAMIYFRPRYNTLEISGRLAKVWALICMTLFFCCHDEDGGRGSEFDSDYVRPPTGRSSRNFNGRSSRNFGKFARLEGFREPKNGGGARVSDEEAAVSKNEETGETSIAMEELKPSASGEKPAATVNGDAGDNNMGVTLQPDV